MPTPPPCSTAVRRRARAHAPADRERGRGERGAGEAEFDRQHVVGRVLEQERDAEEQHDDPDAHDRVAAEQPVACGAEGALDEVGPRGLGGAGGADGGAGAAGVSLARIAAAGVGAGEAARTGVGSRCRYGRRCIRACGGRLGRRARWGGRPKAGRVRMGWRRRCRRACARSRQLWPCRPSHQPAGRAATPLRASASRPSPRGARRARPGEQAAGRAVPASRTGGRRAVVLRLRCCSVLSRQNPIAAPSTAPVMAEKSRSMRQSRPR